MCPSIDLRRKLSIKPRPLETVVELVQQAKVQRAVKLIH